MKKFKDLKSFVIIVFSIAVALCLVFGLLWNVKFPLDTIFTDHNTGPFWSSDAGELDFGVFHIIFNSVLFILIVGVIVFLIRVVIDDDDIKDKYINKPGDVEEEDTAPKKKKIYQSFRFWIGVGLGIILINVLSDVASDLKLVYNKSKVYHNLYVQKVAEKEGYYDKMWKTYLMKNKITELNKETFIYVTKLIMENRKDGKNLAWKWLQENQNIPFEEFTKFYADLSVFVYEQREGYFNIEKECQTLSTANNMLLDTFPNNMYNSILKCERIDYRYSFLSDSTNQIFNSKIENIK